MSDNKGKFQRYQYENAPIQEAIFEAKFSYESFDTVLPGQVYERIRGEYPEKNDLSIIAIALGTAQSKPQTPPPPPQAPVMQAWNKERTHCLQFGPGIVAANNLKYRSWEDFVPAIHLSLKSYIELAKPRATTRVGMRYINRFVIPKDDVQITDYFQFGLVVPQALSNAHAFDVTLVKKNSVHALNSEMVTKARFASDTLKPGETGVAFILDIDSFMTAALPSTPAGILEVANLAHEAVEEVFESILQDDTRTMLGGRRK